MGSEQRWLLAGAAVALLVVAIAAWCMGNEAGMAAGAAGAAAAASQYWRARGRDEGAVSDAADAVATTRVDAEAELDKSRAEVSSMSGDEKADLIDRLTDPETET